MTDDSRLPTSNEWTDKDHERMQRSPQAAITTALAYLTADPPMVMSAIERLRAADVSSPDETKANQYKVGYLDGLEAARQTLLVQKNAVLERSDFESPVETSAPLTPAEMGTVARMAAVSAQVQPEKASADEIGNHCKRHPAARYVLKYGCPSCSDRLPASES